jgi:hypothetical protein
MSGLVATQRFSNVQVDLQASIDTRLFRDEFELGVPIAIGVTWVLAPQLRVYGDAVERLDLTNLTDSGTSVMGGAGWRFTNELSVDAAARLGLSPSLPDVAAGVGFTWQPGNLF